MTVGADEAAVKADVSALKSRNGGELSGEEILLGDAVIVVQERKYGKLDTVLAVVGIGHAADENIQRLSLDALGHRLLHLVGGKVWQEIGDDKLRILRLAADDHVNHVAVFERDDAVQLERNRNPLVFLDSAVIMRFKICHLGILKQRQLLEIEARRIDVRAGNHTALAQGLFADDREDKGLAAVVEVNLVPCLECHAGNERHKALVLRQFNAGFDSLALGARGVHKALIALAVGIDQLRLLGVDQIVAVFLFIEQVFSPILLTHLITSILSFRHFASNAASVPELSSI